MKIIKEMLYSLSETDYKKFNEKLIPAVDKNTVLGVRIPILRKLAKNICKEQWAGDFIRELPHEYFEENNLHAFIIENQNDFDTALKLTEEFLPFIDNWATCDSFFPKIFSKHIDEIDRRIDVWLDSDHEYTQRFALGLIMRLHLEDNFNPEYLKRASLIKSDKYYVNMMISWLFATALAKKEEQTLEYILDRKLEPWIHNKTIQKALESNRISDQLKEKLKKCKIPK